MVDVALCIVRDHHPWLLLLAVLVCAAGSFTVCQMFESVRSTAGFQRFGWVFLTSIAAGATIWCTHFVAMIAYEAEVRVSIDPVLTIVSLIIAVLGASAGLTAAGAGNGLAWRLAGGALLGCATAAMHYIGMLAYRVDGIVVWNWSYVIASVLVAIAFAALSFAVLGSERPPTQRIGLGTAILVGAIASLHFTGMTALAIYPMALSDAPLDTETKSALGLATALVGFLVIAAGVAAALIDRHTRSDATRKLRHMALSDALTGLPNRVSFQQKMLREIELAQVEGRKLAVIGIDLNRFKEINDLHGHKAGDQVLVALSGRMLQELPDTSTVARLGGDEFVALVRVTTPHALTALAHRLDEVLQEPIDLGNFDARVGASIGIAIYPDDADQPEALTNNADLAMYRAKREGGVKPRFYDATLDDAVRARRELAADLRRAMEQNQLELHYQIQTSVKSGEATGYEALLRWCHPLRGNVPPAEFIPIAEENGLILGLGEWVLRRACKDAVGWADGAKVAINVSPLQLAHADLPKLFHEVLIETGLPPRRLEIELTESAIMADRARALHTLRQIKALGVSVALDDFGTGYSSLETLRIFPFDKIKLDRFFISGLEESPHSIAIIRAVLALGKSLEIPVLAEGIETQQQLDVLHREGCNEAQGYLLGRPAAVRTKPLARTSPDDAAEHCSRVA